MKGRDIYLCFNDTQVYTILTMAVKAEKEQRKRGRKPKRDRRSSERVYIMDRDVDGRYSFRHKEWHTGNVIGGTLLILVGILLFLNYSGVIPWYVWQIIWSFWPVFLILFGVRMILGHNRISRIVVGLLTTVVFALIVLFAVRQVHSAFRQQLPMQLNQILDQMKGVRVQP